MVFPHPFIKGWFNGLCEVLDKVQEKIEPWLINFLQVYSEIIYSCFFKLSLHEDNLIDAFAGQIT